MAASMVGKVGQVLCRYALTVGRNRYLQPIAHLNMYQGVAI